MPWSKKDDKGGSMNEVCLKKGKNEGFLLKGIIHRGESRLGSKRVWGTWHGVGEKTMAKWEGKEMPMHRLPAGKLLHVPERKRNS